MKTINSIMLLIGATTFNIIGVGLSITYLNGWYRIVSVGLVLILGLTLYILGQRYENGLESKLELLELDIEEHEKGLRKKDLIIRTRDERINELEKQTYVKYGESIAKIEGTFTSGEPFAEENDNTEQIFTCPECGETMHRHTSKTWFCDNIECDRKQWHIDKLTK